MTTNQIRKESLQEGNMMGIVKVQRWKYHLGLLSRFYDLFLKQIAVIISTLLCNMHLTSWTKKKKDRYTPKLKRFSHRGNEIVFQLKNDLHVTR